MATAIIALGVLYFLGHVLTHVFDRTKIPDVLILIIFGIILGPVLGLITTEAIGGVGQLFTSMALIIILFEGGLDLELLNVWRSAKQAVRLTVSFFFITAAIIFCIMHYGFGYSTMAALVTGFICGGTSSAVVIPIVSAISVGKETSAILILESALTDVLCIVFTIGALQSIDDGAIDVGKIIGNLISSFVLASIIGILGGIMWMHFLDKIRSYSNTQFATFAFMFIVYGIAESLQFSGAIASLAFGIILGNYQYVVRTLNRFKRLNMTTNASVVSDAEKKLYKEIVFLIKIFFFIYLGICIPFEHIHIVTIALSIVAALYLARPFATKLLVTRRASAYDRSIISVMVPKGLAAAVLATLPAQHGIGYEGDDIQAITYNIVLISIIVTSALIPLIERTPIGQLYNRALGPTADVKEKDSTTEA